MEVLRVHVLEKDHNSHVSKSQGKLWIVRLGRDFFLTSESFFRLMKCFEISEGTEDAISDAELWKLCRLSAIAGWRFE